MPITLTLIPCTSRSIRLGQACSKSTPLIPVRNERQCPSEPNHFHSARTVARESGAGLARPFWRSLEWHAPRCRDRLCPAPSLEHRVRRLQRPENQLPRRITTPTCRESSGSAIGSPRKAHKSCVICHIIDHRSSKVVVADKSGSSPSISSSLPTCSGHFSLWAKASVCFSVSGILLLYHPRRSPPPIPAAACRAFPARTR